MFLCWLGSLYIRLVSITGRWRIVGADIPEHFFTTGKPFILAFWHGRLLMMPRCWRKDKTIHVLISMHRDGRLLADTVGHLGMKTIAGSSSKGGATALRAMVKTLKEGNYIGITPDGPRGPRMRASDGIISLARLAKVPVIPIAHASSPRKVLGSWDRFTVSFPFARHVILWGEPIDIPHTADKDKLETARQEVEDKLNALTTKADEMCGHTPIEADDPS
ncbi:MAG: lysophospholipid acyltransferase family protein [Rhodospirillaceae bacterium]|nr:lysophospholipid acyltransferase family protein [Rhodospirillaceae bacterium]MBT4218658.1 lysophospholipid acyltransferase family protein [Rhodospirillaceae bacterium]MBT4464038.1 lysophospholipid acyltransferase family protein [Rhodospirillaceae bacterium]MBT5012985.1 lysophospholipid acyltransferase family protein [Rhodospirillaceae bacterium]MBT5309929.1 lysophospholipid acyltransferase family protein [Rhodospirillaceae bacterium]